MLLFDVDMSKRIFMPAFRLCFYTQYRLQHLLSNDGLKNTLSPHSLEKEHACLSLDADLPALLLTHILAAHTVEMGRSGSCKYTPCAQGWNGSGSFRSTTNLAASGGQEPGLFTQLLWVELAP
jgi:hypothetical protein